jgi:hypothetical protein
MAKPTLSIEDRLAAIEQRLNRLEGKPGEGWQPLPVLAAHPDSPYSRWTLISQIRAALKDPSSSKIKSGVHFVNDTGRYYVRPIPYLKAMGVQVNE